MAAKQSLSEKINELEQENRRLKRQLSRVESSNQTSHTSRWRRFAIVLLVGVAGAMFVVGSLVFWTGRTLIDNDRYVAATAPLIQNPDIQQAIVTKTTTTIFEQVNVEQIAQESLPPRAQFLAPTLATQVKNFTNSQLNTIVASQGFQNVWNEVNKNAQLRLVTAIKESKSDGTINISDVYNRLSQRLADTKLSFLANKQLPSNVGSVTLVNAPNLPKVRWVINNLWWVRLVSIGLFLILTVGAVWIAKNRRALVVRIALLYSILSLVLLLAVRIGGRLTASSAPTDYQAAAQAAWNIVLSSFVTQMAALAVAFALIALIAWVGGSGKGAVRVRQAFQSLLQGKLHAALFKKETAVTRWFARSKRIVQVIILALAFLLLLLIPLTVINVVLLAVATLVAIAFTEVMAAEK